MPRPPQSPTRDVLSDPPIAELIRLGYLCTRPTKWPSITAATKQFQRDHGLRMDGQVGPVTTRHLLGAPRICALGDRTPKCKWPGARPKIRWQILTHPPALNREQWQALHAQTTAIWAALADVDIAPATTRPNVVINSGTIDGPAGVLAWANLPCSTRAPLEMRLDASEPWGRQGEDGRLNAFLVVLHEWGHLLGLAHIPPARGVAIMNPSYNPALSRPTNEDAAALLRLYPPAPPNPAPSPDPPATAFHPSLLKITRVTYDRTEYPLP